MKLTECYNFFFNSGEVQRKQNLQSPMVNMTLTSSSDQRENKENPENQTQPMVKEDFIKASNSQSSDSLNADPFDQNSEIVDNQIQNMTREAGDGQNDNGNENTE